MGQAAGWRMAVAVRRVCRGSAAVGRALCARRSPSVACATLGASGRARRARVPSRAVGMDDPMPQRSAP